MGKGEGAYLIGDLSEGKCDHYGIGGLYDGRGAYLLSFTVV